jgi:hypothetical protein
MEFRQVDIREQFGHPVLVVLVIHFVIWLPAFLTLGTVDVPRPLVPLDINPDPTPLGYTVSLTLWFIPALAIIAHLLTQRLEGFPWKSLGVTVGLLLSLGLLLDIAFGNLFFVFPNRGATIGVDFWGWDWSTMGFVRNIPLEEIFFYLFGDSVALLIYLWCDRFWLKLYSRNANPYLVAEEGRLLRIAWWPLLLGASMVASAWAYKAFVAKEPGFPAYFLFLVAVAFVPATLFYTKVQRRINWRAYGCTALTMFFISMLWECTIAFPYGWWAYKPAMMMGMDIFAWSRLPAEEPFLWLLVSFSSVMIFETIHAAMGSEARVSEAVLGVLMRRKV